MARLEKNTQKASNNMGVYIKGMKMPKEGTCDNCILKHYHSADDAWSCHGVLVEDGGFYIYAPLEEMYISGHHKRLPNCPLVEVAEPHGRLIDADALMVYCRNQKSRTIDCNDIARFPTTIPRVIAESEE